MQPVRGLPFVLAPGMRVALTPPALKRDRFCRVEDVADTGDAWHVRFSGIRDLTAAEGVAGCYVLADAADLDLGPLDASFEELVGRSVVDARYGAIGTIAEIMETPANDVWVVAGGPYGEVLMPVIEDVVPRIPATGPIAVSLMDGLIDVPPAHEVPDEPKEGR